MKALGASRVLNPARPISLRHGPTVAVQEALKQGQPDSRCVVQIRLRDELCVGLGAEESKLTQSGGNGIGDNHTTAMSSEVMQVEVDSFASSTKFDPLESFIKGSYQLWVRVGKARRRLASQATVAEQKAKRIRVQWHIAMRKLGRRAQQWQLKPVLMGSPQAIDHGLRLDDPAGLATTSIACRENVPKVLAAAQR